MDRQTSCTINTVCHNDDMQAVAQKKIDLWMVGRNFDLFFFQISGLLCLLLIFPYRIWGDASVLPIYNFYLVFFGLPHNFLTWAHIMPNNVRASYNLDLIKQAAVVCLILCLLIPFARGTELENWILSIITYASLWHAYRQHHGICKIYDSIQAQRSQDGSVFADRRVINLFLGLSLHTVLVWAFTHDRIPFLLSADAMYELVYPQIPWRFFEVYVGVTCVIGIWGLKRCLWDRYREGKPLPWPQVGIIFTALATYVVPYVFVPLEAIPVSIAIGTIFHNIQYFVFVWLAEKYRSKELIHNQISLHQWQRLAQDGHWKRFLSISLLYSFAIVALYLMMPTSAALVMIYFLGFAHYIIDGLIWKRDNNKLLSPLIKRLAMGG